MQYCFTLFLVLSFLFNSKTSIAQTKEFKYLNLVNDTGVMTIDSIPVFVIVINEPSCTSCKYQIGDFSSTIKDQCIVVALVTAHSYIVGRRLTEKELINNAPAIERFTYSFNNQNTQFIYNGKLYSINSTQSPQAILLTPHKESPIFFKYNKVFRKTVLRKSFPKKINKWLKD